MSVHRYLHRRRKFKSHTFTKFQILITDLYSALCQKCLAKAKGWLYSHLPPSAWTLDRSRPAIPQADTELFASGQLRLLWGAETRSAVQPIWNLKLERAARRRSCLLYATADSRNFLHGYISRHRFACFKMASESYRVASQTAQTKRVKMSQNYSVAKLPA
jgi:hypothetical protein